ncbi:MFS transporter [Streptomyces noursei]|uniref:MFS transporter n=1 Tax=Streptomyces noursei TaxID=1971 RepID=UPI00331BEB21
MHASDDGAPHGAAAPTAGGARPAPPARSAWLTGPMRRLLLAGAVDWLGTGLLLAASVVYFTKIVGLSAPAVGTGLAVAGVVAMTAALPVGALADRFGPRRVLIGLYLVRAAATLGYLAVSDWWGLVAAAAFRLLGDQATSPLVQSLAAEVATGSDRVRLMAVYRVVVNVAVTVSTPLAGYAIGVGTFPAFAVLLVGNAVAFLATTGVLLRLPPPRPAPRPDGPGTVRVLRDGRLLGLTALDCLLSLWQPLLSLAMPLWVVERTGAPRFTVGVLYAVNTALCILVQVPAGRLSAAPRAAARSYAVVAVLLVATCALFGAAGATDGAFTVVLLAAAVLALTAAEVLQVGASWTLSFALAPEALRSQYLSAFGLGRTAARTLLGPLALTAVVTAPGARGWLLAGAVLAAVAALVPPLLRRFLSATEPRPPGGARA